MLEDYRELAVSDHYQKRKFADIDLREINCVGD
jgi:hypothetical protein